MKFYRVKILFIKMLLVLSALLILGYVIAIASLQKVEAKKKENISNQENIKQSSQIKYQKHHTAIENADIIVDKLSFSSKTDNNNPYNVIADKAVKSEEGGYFMNNIIANVTFENDILKINAQDGFYNDDQENLELFHQVKGKYQGYNFKADSMIVNLKTKNLFVPTKISIDDEKLSLTADQLKTEGENIIKLEGHVKTCINFNN